MAQGRQAAGGGIGDIRRGEDHRRVREQHAPREAPDGDIGDDRDARGDAGERPGHLDVECPHGADGQHTHATLGAGELPDHRAEKGGGGGDLQAGEEIGQRGHRPHMNQRREPAAAVAAHEVEPARRGGAQADEERDQRGVVDRERGKGDLRPRAGAEGNAQDRADRDQRQAEDQKGEARDHPLAAGPDEGDGRQRHCGEIAQKEACDGIREGDSRARGR